MRTIIPPTTNQFISMLKDSSLISVTGVWEVMFLAQSYGRSSYRYIEMLTPAAIIYWLMSFALELIQARIDRKSVVSGKSEPVRVDLAGRRIIKKKKLRVQHINTDIHQST